MGARSHGHTPYRARALHSRRAAPFTQAGGDAPSLPGAPGAPRPQSGATAAWLRPEAAARRGLARGSDSARCTALTRLPGPGPRTALPLPPPEAAARGPEAVAAARPPPRARPVSRDQGLGGVGEGPPRPRRGPRRPERAEDPLPPAGRRPGGAGSSLTRAIVAVAILRPSRPPRAPHAPAPSAVSRDVGARGGARRKTELSR